MSGKRAANALLLAGLLALSACGSQQPTGTGAAVPAPGPVTSGTSRSSLGVYQLSLSGAGSAIKQASVQRLGAQATEVGGLSFKSNNYGYYVDSSNNTLRMWATFDVTNTSDQPLAAPTFIPVDTEGAGGTIGTTAFKNVRYFDGSDASSRAPLLAFDSSNDPKTAVKTQLLRDLDSGSVQVNLPAGLQLAGTSHTGWKMGALPAGATGQVTLAASIPAASNSQDNPFSFDLVFTVADNVPTTTLTNIGAVQGQTPGGDRPAALTGAQTIEGVVTAVEPGLSGFFVQEEGIDADKDDTTSDGLFVYCAANCPALSAGDRVRVSGTVAEYGGATQMTAPTVTKLLSGLALPPAAELKLPLDKTLQERYEGMRVRFPETLTITNNYTYGRYGQLDLSNAGRMFNPTNGNASASEQSTITLDDGISAQNPLDLNYLSAERTRRTGDTVTGLSGVWHSVANQPMLEPEGAVEFVSANSRASNALPHDVGGSLRVGGANVLNYFTTYGGSTDRGANNAGELARQRAKMATTLTTLNADVLSLMEVQNNGDTALNDLVAALNEKAGAGTYAAVTTGSVGTDAIKVAIIYKPSKVTPVGQFMTDNNSVFSRPPVAQTFRDKTTGGVFSVIANHLKSKGSCPTSGDVDTGQGCWNQLRVRQAQALLGFVDTVKQKSGDQDVLLLGDFNAYGAEDPIKALQNSGFESLNLRIPAEDRYSYQFNGLFGYLDHALASQNLGSQVSGITEWHVNSDEPVIADYNTEFKKVAGCTGTNCTGIDLFDPTNPFRASDHDPVLVGLNLTADAGTTPTPAPTTALSANPSALTVTAGGAAMSSTLTTSTQNYGGADFTVSTQNSAGLTVTPSATAVSPNGTFTVSVTAPAGTAAGTYPVTVTTTGAGGLTATATLNVTVSADGTPPPSSTGSDLMISEYVEGTSNNKALEFYNPTANTLDLSAYTVELYANGATKATNTQKLTGSLAPGAVLVLVNGSAIPGLKAKGTVSSVTNFNGDDAIVLKKSGVVIDSFGQVGVQSMWGADVTLRRKSGIVSGDSNPNDPFSAATEWDSFPVDTFDGLGSR